MPDQPEPFRYIDADGDILNIAPIKDDAGADVVWLNTETTDGVHVPLPDLERVVAAIRAASGVQPDTRRVPDCLFCQPGTAENRVVAENATAYLRLDNYPSSSGHMEVVPKRHVVSFFDLTSAELDDVYTLACDARAHVPDADGWTIGVNEGRAAGRTVDHLHVHLIPRRHGDVADPSGGVRWVLPDTAALPDTREHHTVDGVRHLCHTGDHYCPSDARPVPDTERRAEYATALAKAAGSKAFAKTGPEWDHARGAWGLHADASMAVADEEQRDLREALRKAQRAVGLLAGSHREAELLRAELEKARATTLVEAAAGSGGQAEDGAQPAPAGDPDCERCDGTGLDPDAYTEQQNPDGSVWYRHEPCTGLLCATNEDGAQQK